MGGGGGAGRIAISYYCHADADRHLTCKVARTIQTRVAERLPPGGMPK